MSELWKDSLFASRWADREEGESMNLQCEGCRATTEIERVLDLNLCPPCREKLDQSFDARYEMETKVCPKCGQQMALQDEGNYPELNTYWFECECGYDESY